MKSQFVRAILSSFVYSLTNTNHVSIALYMTTLCFMACVTQDETHQDTQTTTEEPKAFIPLAHLEDEFVSREVEGLFLWYDLKENQYYVYNDFLVDQRESPASTFKILNALIALETGVIKDTHEIIPWDGVDRNWDKWNQDQTLATGMEYSALWAYQEIAKRVNAQDSMAYDHYLKRANYGNEHRSADVTWFWLDNSLQISPREQIEFLTRLYLEKLPFKSKNVQQVKGSLKQKNLAGYSMSGKTGWARLGERNVAWFVGYMEKGDQVYFFCTRIEKMGQIENKGAFRKIYMGLTEEIIEILLS